MKIKFILSFLTTVFVLLSCSKTEQPSNNFAKIYDYNVLIVPDLSNRINPEIHPKPIHDTLLIHTILDSIGSLLKVNNRQMNQLDIYKFDFINKGILSDTAKVADAEKMEINFKKFENQLKDASDFKRNTLQSNILTFKKEVSKVYNFSLQNSAGSDVWNYFNETIKSSLLNEPDKIDNESKIIKIRKNIVVLFTDGYIESANNGSGYTFDQQLIKKIREDFLNSKSVDLEKFIQLKPDYLIKKTSNNLNNADILVLEMTDRSLDKNGSTTIQPTDFEIMKIIWKQWLKNSGASHVEIYPAFSKKADAYEALKKFMTEIKS